MANIRGYDIVLEMEDLTGLLPSIARAVTLLDNTRKLTSQCRVVLPSGIAVYGMPIVMEPLSQHLSSAPYIPEA